MLSNVNAFDENSAPTTNFIKEKGMNANAHLNNLLFTPYINGSSYLPLLDNKEYMSGDFKKYTPAKYDINNIVSIFKPR